MKRLAIALITVASIASLASAITIFLAMSSFRAHLPKPPSAQAGNAFPQQLFGGQQQSTSSPSTQPGPPFGP